MRTFWCITCRHIIYRVGPAITHEYEHPAIREIGRLP